ncbi:MAG TPA: hypothetical protein VFG50_11285, partial [Rhodothermales bacterium]|nr:hypothetical protein [Rhodothermales bacterium]
MVQVVCGLPVYGSALSSGLAERLPSLHERLAERVLVAHFARFLSVVSGLLLVVLGRLPTSAG